MNKTITIFLIFFVLLVSSANAGNLDVAYMINLSGNPYSSWSSPAQTTTYGFVDSNINGNVFHIYRSSATYKSGTMCNGGSSQVLQVFADEYNISTGVFVRQVNLTGLATDTLCNIHKVHRYGSSIYIWAGINVGASGTGKLYKFSTDLSSYLLYNQSVNLTTTQMFTWWIYNDSLNNLYTLGNSSTVPIYYWNANSSRILIQKNYIGDFGRYYSTANAMPGSAQDIFYYPYDSKHYYVAFASGDSWIGSNINEYPNNFSTGDIPTSLNQKLSNFDTRFNNGTIWASLEPISLGSVKYLSTSSTTTLFPYNMGPSGTDVLILLGFIGNNIPAGWEIVNNSLFSNIQCIDNETLSNSVSLAQMDACIDPSFGHSDLCLYGVQSISNGEEFNTRCAIGCHTAAWSSPLNFSSLYSQYYEGMCDYSPTLPCTSSCYTNGAFVCTGGKGYEQCGDWDGNGCYRYAPLQCGVSDMCGGSSNTVPCSPYNFTGWTFSSYDFTFTPRLVIDAIQNAIYDSSIRGALSLVTLPTFINYVTTSLSDYIGGVVVKTASGIIAIAKATYNDNLVSYNYHRAYTSLNCDYKETQLLSDNTIRIFNDTLIYNISSTSLSEKIYLNFNYSTNATIFNLTLTNGVSNAVDLSFNYINNNYLDVYNSKDNSLLFSDVASSGISNTLVTIDINKPTNSYTVSIKDIYKIRTTTNIYDTTMFSPPLISDGSNPTILKLKVTSGEPTTVGNVLINSRSEYSGYTNASYNNYDSYACNFVDNNCHLVRLFSSISPQPAFHQYKDYYTCITLNTSAAAGGGSGTTTTPTNPSGTLSGSDILTSLYGANSPTSDRLVRSVLYIFIMTLLLIMAGAMIGSVGIFTTIAAGLDVMFVVGMTLAGVIPVWVTVLLCVVAGAIGWVVFRNWSFGGSGGE
jgi:hypothetical protein